MKTFSAYNDDGITVIVIADSEEQAAKKTADKIAEIDLEIELDFFEDDIDDSFVSDDETVSDWLTRKGVAFTENNMLIMEWNDIEQSVEVYQL
jgi:hypothetical protein